MLLTQSLQQALRQLRIWQVRNWQLRNCLGSILLMLFAFVPYESAFAEGSWQMGLFEGLSYRQPLRETSTAGLGRNVLYVDILSPGEVINVLVCGKAVSDNMQVRVIDPLGATVYNNTAPGNVDCQDDFNRTFDPATTNVHQHVTTTSGTYRVHLINASGIYIDRYDVTVTDSVSDLIDPREPGGRLWSDYWYFWAGSFAETRSTDADLYVVADGGFLNTYYIWKLDLTNFAGYGYGLKANDIGVRSPNAAGDVVAGMSVPKSGNAIDAKFQIYLSYPEKNYPRPGAGAGISELTFEDSTRTDNAITPTQSGTFLFETNITSSAIYEIIIDISDPNGGPPDDIFGQGDIYLRGIASSGLNQVEWNGRDNNGNTIPVGIYNARLSLRLGEFHFVADDVETSGGPGSPGIKIYIANPDGSDTPTTVYWDDFTVMNSTGPNAFNQTGIYDGDHNWGVFNSGGVGNNTYIDTYGFVERISPNPTPVAIVEDDTVLIGIAKSFTPNSINAGDISQLQLEISYTGTTPQTGITLTDAMPEGMTLVGGSQSITVTGAGCTGFTFGADTVAGGNMISVVDGNIAPGSVCMLTANVTAGRPAELVNQSSAVTSNENSFGVPSNYASLFVTPDASGTPFACDGNAYEMEIIGPSTRLYNVDTFANSRTEFTGVNYTPANTYRYNGLAYNPIDGYLYGIVTESNGGASDPVVGSIVRIDQEGKVVNTGLPVEGPNTMGMPLVSDRFVGGTMTAEGKYVVVTDNSPTTHTGVNIPANERGLIVEIDVTVSPAKVLFNWQHGLDVGDIYAHPDGRLLSHASTVGHIEIDSETGNVVVLGGDNGEFYPSLTGTPSGQLRVGSLASTADGASCTYGIGLQKTVSVIEVEANNAVTYELSLINGGATSVTFDLLDNLQDSRSYVAGSLVNPLGGTVNAYDDTSLLTITGASLGPHQSATVQFDVMYPAGVGRTAYNQAQVQVPGQAQVASDYPATAIYGDATPIEVIGGAAVGIAKRAAVSGSEVTYWFTVKNTGSGELTDLTLSDDLNAVFGAGNYTVTLPPILEDDPGSMTLNTGFNGNTDIVLIDEVSASTLAEGESATLRLSVTVNTLSDMGAGIGVYSNQVDIFANGFAITDLSVDGSTVDPNNDGIADEESPTVVSLAGAFVVSGTVFEDNSATSAHDGVQDINEQGIAGVTVELRDTTGMLINTSISSADGSYEITIPMSYDGSQLQVVALAKPGFIGISEASATGNTSSLTDGVVIFTPNSINGNIYQVDFGRVKQPSWLNDSVKENSPGSVVLHPHQYRANSSGILTFAYVNETSVPANSGFSAQLFHDKNCNGVIENSENEITESLGLSNSTVFAANCSYVNAGSNGGWGYDSSTGTSDNCPPLVDGDSHLVCVVNKVIIPANTSKDNTYTNTIAASFSYSDDTGTGHGQTYYQELVDITRTVVEGEGVLVLHKWVQNLNDGAVKSTRNAGYPGDVLRYTVDFNNNGTGQVTEVMIADSTPAYSVLQSPVACPPSLPDGTISCSVLVPTGAGNTAGYSGPVRWLFDGALPAGGRGTVSFDVLVE